MDLRVLGPIEVADGDTTVSIGGPRQRLVLALLILNANATVSTDRLVDGVWDDDPPDAARRTVQAYVSNLRKALESVRPDTLVPRSPGYTLLVDDELIDCLRFEGAVERARSVLESNPAGAGALLRDALALWRGSPYADLAGALSLRSEITRLEELRRSAIEMRIATDLALGRHTHVVGELETLVAEHPFSERFACQLMLALYRSGRQADALRVALRTRTTLGEELGVEPSHDLRDLEQSILDHDPSLQAPTPATDEVPGRVGPDVIRGFEIRRRIGGSPWAETYVAYQRSLEREVAVRVIDPRYASDPHFMRRFQAGISNMIRVTHPNIVPFYDMWQDADGAYIVRRYFPRGSLADAVARGAWKAEDTPRLVAQIGSALEAVHRHGFIHRDVKPSDILLDEASNAYITDFAITKETFADDEAYLNHVHRQGTHLTDEELLAAPTPQIDIRALASVAHRLLEGSGISRDVAGVLHRAENAGPSDQYTSMSGFVDAFLAVSGDAEATAARVTHNPYKGLRAFGEADRADFFGREAFVSSLLPRLASPDPGCLALVGASGVGKSSILNAGLIPALRDGVSPGSENWSVVKMHPGGHPYGELAGALRHVAVDADPQILGHLTWGDIGIGDAITSVLDDSTAEILLVIDQFEEIFTLVRDETVRAAFIESLVAAVENPEVHLRLVIVLRADFYDRPLRYPKLAELLTGCMVTVLPMTASELHDAITEPAERVGAAIDPGLAGRIVDDVQHQPGMLPLVQFALTDLFEHRDGNRITAAAYEELGGVAGPLGIRPEEIYVQLNEETQGAARQVFLHLVALGEDAEAVRRRVQQSELTSIVGFEHSARVVIDAFGQARLLSFDRHPVTRSPTVEIAHDALLREWIRLRGWIDDHRSDVRLHQRLAHATNDWVLSGRDAEFLLTGGMLDRLAGWSRATDFALSDAERSLIDSSIEVRDLEERREAVRIEHEREIEERSRRRLRMLIAVWVLTALVAVLAVFAFAQWRRSEALVQRAETVAIADHLAAVAIVERAGDPQLGLLLALQAVEMTSGAGAEVTPAARGALTIAISAAGGSVRQGEGDSTPPRLEELVGTARSLLVRGFTSQECSSYLGLDVCPVDTIASPIGS